MAWPGSPYTLPRAATTPVGASGAVLAWPPKKALELRASGVASAAVSAQVRREQALSAQTDAIVAGGDGAAARDAVAEASAELVTLERSISDAVEVIERTRAALLAEGRRIAAQRSDAELERLRAEAATVDATIHRQALALLDSLDRVARLRETEVSAAVARARLEVLADDPWAWQRFTQIPAPHPATRELPVRLAALTGDHEPDLTRIGDPAVLARTAEEIVEGRWNG
jgi:hypothetical protein